MTIPQLTQIQRDLILFEETEKRFGYKVEDLSHGSLRLVIHKCSVCGLPKETQYKFFLLKSDAHCKCGYIKRKRNYLTQHGVESPMQLLEVREKAKQTCLDKFGVENASQSREIKEKKKQTALMHYGVECPNQSAVVQKKRKQTCLKRYGVEHPNQSKEIQKEKRRVWLGQQNQKVSGVEIREDLKQLLLIEETFEKYGYKIESLSSGSPQRVIHKCDVCGKLKESFFREFVRGEKTGHVKCSGVKHERTNLKRYGVKHPRQIKEVVERARPKRIQTWLRVHGVECSIENAESMALLYVQQELQKEGYKLISNQYVNTTTKMKTQCSQGHDYWVRWNDFQSGSRCSICSEGKSERELGQILEQLYPGLVKPQDNLDFLGQQRVDYSVRINSLAFEYDGKQHFEPLVGVFGSYTEEEAIRKFQYQQKCDRRKNRLCKKNGYRLVRIAYNEKLCLETIQQKIS